MTLKRKDFSQRTRDWIERGRYYGHDATVAVKSNASVAVVAETTLAIESATTINERDPAAEDSPSPRERFYRRVARLACPEGDAMFEDFFEHFHMILKSLIILRQHERLSYSNHKFWRETLQPAFDHVCVKWEPRITQLTGKPLKETCPAFGIEDYEFMDIVRDLVSDQLKSENVQEGEAPSNRGLL